MNSYRKRRLLFVSCMLVAVTSANAQSSQATPHSPVADYEGIGNDGVIGPMRCFDTSRFLLNVRKCSGYPGKPLGIVGEDDEKLIDRLERLNWGPMSEWSERAPAVAGQPTPLMSIQVMPAPRKFQLKSISSDGIIVARIWTRTNSAKDKRFGIGGPSTSSTLDSVFYLAISGYDAADTRDVTANGDSLFSRKVSNWYVYGVSKGSKTNRRILVRAGNTGTFRWCGITHSYKEEAAMFTNCEKYHKLVQTVALRNKSNPRTKFTVNSVLREIRAGVAAKSAIRLKDFGDYANPVEYWEKFLRTAEDPAWMPCGGGCCTADVLLY